MKIEIEKANNGAILKTDDKDDFSTDIYKFDDDNLDGLVEMLYEICDFVGQMGDRHDKLRIRISVLHGDKYLCMDKKCDICKE